MHAQHLNRDTAVRLSLPARHAFLARQVGVDDDVLSYRNGGRSVDLDNGARNLVAHDARIGEERMLAFEDVIVGTADADMGDVDQCPSFRWTAERRPVGELKLSWSDASDGFHAGVHVGGVAPAMRWLSN